MEKRKVGRPRKTSKNAVILDVKKEKVANNWKEKHDLLAKELELAKSMIFDITNNANSVVEKQADRQLDIVKLTLDSYSTMEQHCKEVVELTGSIDESDVLYLTSVARRALLHKFVEFNADLED